MWPLSQTRRGSFRCCGGWCRPSWPTTQSERSRSAEGPDHLAELSKLVDLAQIPDFLGGGSKCAIPSGIESVDIVISGGLPVVPEETPRQLEAVAVS